VYLTGHLDRHKLEELLEDGFLQIRVHDRDPLTPGDSPKDKVPYNHFIVRSRLWFTPDGLVRRTRAAHPRRTPDDPKLCAKIVYHRRIVIIP
jgi:hypothetical protein